MGTKKSARQSQKTPPQQDEVRPLYEPDLRIWASAMVGFLDGQPAVWAHFHEWWGNDSHFHSTMRAIGRNTKYDQEISTDRISEAELLRWWKGICQQTGCEWNESAATAKVAYLQLLQHRVGVLQNEAKALSNLLGRAAPVWLRVAASRHYCAACRNEEELLDKCSSFETFLKLELEQARARLVFLENIEAQKG